MGEALGVEQAPCLRHPGAAHKGGRGSVSSPRPGEGVRHCHLVHNGGYHSVGVQLLSCMGAVRMAEWVFVDAHEKWWSGWVRNWYAPHTRDSLGGGA